MGVSGVEGGRREEWRARGREGGVEGGRSVKPEFNSVYALIHVRK